MSNIYHNAGLIIALFALSVNVFSQMRVYLWEMPAGFARMVCEECEKSTKMG